MQLVQRVERTRLFVPVFVLIAEEVRSVTAGTGVPELQPWPSDCRSVAVVAFRAGEIASVPPRIGGTGVAECGH